MDQGNVGVYGDIMFGTQIPNDQEVHYSSETEGQKKQTHSMVIKTTGQAEAKAYDLQQQQLNLMNDGQQMHPYRVHAFQNGGNVLGSMGINQENNPFASFPLASSVAAIQEQSEKSFTQQSGDPVVKPAANNLEKFVGNWHAQGHTEEDEDPYMMENISFTDMLLGGGMSSESAMYNNMQQFPLGQENKFFMITERYSYGNEATSEDEQANEPSQQKSFEQENLLDLENSNTWQFDENTTHRDDTTKEDATHCRGHTDHKQGENNTEEDAKNSDDFFDEPTAEYDIFGDAKDETDKTAAVDPNSTDHLTQEDILIFLENESVAAAQTCSQEVRSHHVPCIGQKFNSDDEAFAFYNEYASICGFAVKKAGTYHGKANPSAKHIRATFKCNRSGKIVPPEVLETRKRQKMERKIERTGVAPPANPKRRNINTIEITDCKASMVVSLRDEKWTVITLILQHNHELSPPEESKYLRSHKHMADEEKLFIRTFNSVKHPTRKIMAILSYLRGGIADVPYTKKDVSNVRTAIRQECSQNDMMQVLHYFRKRQADDPRFYYAFKTQGKKVLSIFWTDGNSRKMYDLYGDCVSFDTTYKTNKYNLPFAPFVGITGHGNNCLFACAIMQNEQIETFKWLFETFLDCMGGKHPKTIITDQCVSMRVAIPAIFPEVVHRNCFFHILKKAEEKCSRSFATKFNFHADFLDTLRNSLTVDEFEYLWQQLIQKYDVGNLKYLKAMWDHRRKFVPVYFKSDFYPFIHSTARSEGTNSVFKDNVGSTYSVISFLSEYQRISASNEEKERHQDSVTRTTTPNYSLKTELELQAGEMYNRQIFYRFQRQLVFAGKLHVDEVVRYERYEVYKSRLLAEKDFRPRRYIVLVNLPQQDFTCICCKFQKDGMLCGHVVRVLQHLNISELPEKYYIDRWRPKERKTIRDKAYNVPAELTEKDHHLRYTLLSRRFIDIASEGCRSNAKYLACVEDGTKLEAKLDAMTIAEELEQQQRKQSSEMAGLEQVVVNDGYGEDLENPDVAKPKGRPTVSGRQKTFMEDLLSKQKYTCSHCGGSNHNFATCELKHLPKTTFEKKTPKKKNSGATTSKKKQSTVKQNGNVGSKQGTGVQIPMEL